MRLNGGIRYDNLWQLGHSLGFSFHVSPEVEAHENYFHIKAPSQKVFSLTYVARIPTVPWLSFTLNGVLQDSDVSTLGAFDVVGNGKIAGVRSIFALPAASGFSHNISVGLDYKEFKEKLTITQSTTTSSATTQSANDTTQGDTTTQSNTTKQSIIYTPVNYLTLSAQYLFAWAGQSTQANFSTSVLLNLRPLSSGRFDDKRLNASANFITFHVDASVTQDLFFGMQVFARGYGQYANQPLISSEQVVAGGVTSVRGYLEAEAAGDYGVVGTIELRGPDLTEWFGKPVLTAWRFYVFTDGGWLKILYPSPEQKGRFSPSSIGGGTRLGLFETLQASLDVGVPLAWMGTAGATKTHQVRLQFSVLGQF
jgi:Hemolysin activation/secretion protein